MLPRFVLAQSWVFSTFEGLFESLYSWLSAACFVWPIDLVSVCQFKVGRGMGRQTIGR